MIKHGCWLEVHLQPNLCINIAKKPLKYTGSTQLGPQVVSKQGLSHLFHLDIINLHEYSYKEETFLKGAFLALHARSPLFSL